MGIFWKYKALADNKGRTLGQDAVINYSIGLSVPTSKDLIYQQLFPKIKIGYKITRHNIVNFCFWYN